MPRGGKRLGAGRKPHTRRTRWLGGNAGKRHLELVTPERTAVAGDISGTVAMERPGVLTPNEATYWDLWAPAAADRGLLHESTVPGFVLLCQWAWKERVFWSAIEARGLEQETVTIDGSGQEHRTYKANSMLARWSDAMKRVEQLQARYGLAADGKVSAGGSVDDEETALAKFLSVK